MPSPVSRVAFQGNSFTVASSEKLARFNSFPSNHGLGLTYFWSLGETCLYNCCFVLRK